MKEIPLKTNPKNQYKIFVCTVLNCIHIHLCIIPKVVTIQRFKEPKKFDNIHHKNKNLKKLDTIHHQNKSENQNKRNPFKIESEIK